MNKKPLASKVEDHVCATRYRAVPRDRKTSAKALYADPVPSKSRRPATYIRGDAPKKEPKEIPRLFIRGLVGGSLKVDLLGLGICLSEAAFAYWVADESLKGLQIHRGDIALIDPLRPILQTGAVVLLELNGYEVLRRLTKKNRVWCVEAVDGTKSEPFPLQDHPLLGVLVGLTRLFTKVKPIKYRGTDANFEMSLERTNSGTKECKPIRAARAKSARRPVRYAPRRKTLFLLADETKADLRLSEIEQDHPYST